MTDNNANWKKARIKDVSTPYTGNSIKDEHKELYIDSINAVPYISTKDINDKFQTIDFDNGLFIKNSDKSFRRAPKNSTLLCIEGGNAGKKIAFSDRTVCFVNKLCCFHSKTENNKFLYYFLMSPSFTEEFKSRITGLIGGVSVSTLRNIHIRLPALDEQEKIADFLDEKCAEIDKLSEDIQKQIDILNDYKKSVITRAVTKGLDPNAEMKDSGIEWIGTIPKSWPLIRLKNAAWLKGRIGWQGLRADEFKDDESLPYLITGTDFHDGIVKWDTCAHITEERFNQDKNIQIKEDDLLITKDGTIGKVAIAKKCPQRVSLNSGVFIVRNTGKYKYYSRFMYYVLQSDEFIEWYSVANAGNSTILHLNQEKFYNFVFALPDIEIQKYIAGRLDAKCAHIDFSISEKCEQILRLDSYKKSIIYEYVTGKKRVV